MAQRVVIEHPKSHLTYEVALVDFRRNKAYRDPKTGEQQTYEAAGFQIVSLADGAPYEEPKPAAAAPAPAPAPAPPSPAAPAETPKEG